MSRRKPFTIANTAALAVIAVGTPIAYEFTLSLRPPHGPAVGMIEHIDNKVPGLPVFYGAS